MRRAAFLVLVSLAVVAGGCSALGLSPFGGDGTYPVHAEFDRTFNLFVGSDVRILGVAVGDVRAIVYEPGMRTVEVELAIRDDVRLPADATARIVQGALLGERHVDVEPPYVEGAVLEHGATIPIGRTAVPAEFDEVLRSLDSFLEDLPPDEVARLVDNAADILEGRGEELGETLDDVAVAVEVLRANDDAVVSLTGRLADLNATLATRDQQIGTLIEDWNGLLAELAGERGRIDAALEGVADLGEELASLLTEHREGLTADIRTLTRVGRTADRNLEELDLLLLGQSELYRHARRVFDFERNWLPLVNHSQDLERVMADRLTARLTRVCEELAIERCATPDFWQDGLPDQICVAPLAGCPGDLEALGGTAVDGDGDGVEPTPLSDALRTAIELVPELPDALAADRARRSEAGVASSGTVAPGVAP